MQDTLKWLQEKISDETGESIDQISLTQKFDSMNMDSLSMLSIAHEIESAFQIEVDPTEITEHDCIEKLAQWIEQKK